MRRHEAIPQHQVGGNGPEEIVVEVVVRQVDELEPVALGQPLGKRGFGRALGGARLRHADIEIGVRRGAVRSRRSFAVHTDSRILERRSHHRNAFDKLKSGM